MNHKDRFFATIHHQPVDRPASWLGLPVPSAETALKNYFGVKSIDQLREKIDDDIYPIEVPYNYPPSNHIACAFNFAKVSHLDTPDERTLTAPGFFEDYENPEDVDKFAWPDSAMYLDREESRRRVAAAPADRIKMGILWSADSSYKYIRESFDRGGSNILMSTAPDKTGVYRQAEADSIVKLGKLIREYKTLK